MYLLFELMFRPAKLKFLIESDNYDRCGSPSDTCLYVRTVNVEEANIIYDYFVSNYKYDEYYNFEYFDWSDRLVNDFMTLSINDMKFRVDHEKVIQRKIRVAKNADLNRERNIKFYYEWFCN